MSLEASCFSEYDKLDTVILCKPTFMEILEVINNTQKKYKKENINASIALHQHNELQKVLKKHNVNIVNFEPKKEYPEQVYTRDIGFTLGKSVFLANLKKDIRKGEEKLLAEFLKNEKIPLYSINGGAIEGGDVLIDQDKIWIGISNRTSIEAVLDLEKQLPNFKVFAIPIPAKYLHLDCVFNIISPTEALIYPQAFTKEHLNVIRSHYDLIEVSGQEQFSLGTNVFSIGNRKILSLPVNPEVNNNLSKRGFQVIEVDITEIIKSGGSFRCITLPILRTKQHA